uniref:PGG domain-containing protein n=1 Tax=Aegilops tauschii subsp. strangulata TaxID=200361 RepID=A0A453RD92_AEGTS
MASNNQVASHNPKQPEKQSPDNPSGSNKPSTEYQLKTQLLLLATLVATVTYAAGLNLPGGVWQNTQDGHFAGDPILPDTHYHRYLAFYYCNATAFAASLVACLLLLVLDEAKDNSVWATVLRAVMVLDLLGLMGAYAAGSCRDDFTTIYSSVLVSCVFAYIIYVFVTYAFRWAFPESTEGKASEKQDKDPEKQDKDPEKQDKDPDVNKREEEHEVLMLLATFAVTITYVAGLGPPGGFWGNSQDGHRVSDPIMQDHNSSRYQAFFVCNSTAFVASLLIIVLLLDKKLSQRISKRFVALYGFIAVALIGLVGAYAAGSCREADNTIYVVFLAGAVLAYIFLQMAITEAMNKKDSWDHKVLTSIRDCTSEWLKQIKDWFHTAFSTSRDRGSDKVLEKNRSLVMLLATLVVSITYQAGLDPPGGLWPDDQEEHKGGDPVLLTTHPTRYKVFFYSNSAAFVTSLVVIIMVQSRFLLQRHTLHAAMLLDLFGLIIAYAAGSNRDSSTSIYVVALAGVVLVYVVIHIVFFTLEEHMDKNQDPDKLDNRREMLLLLAILAATLTYQAGLTPPGGFWSADDKFGHHAGFPVLLDNYPRRYNAFFYCNAASFMASVTLIVLLVNPTLYKPGIRCYALYVCMVMGMFGLMGAYAAGSSRHVRTSIYVLTLVAAVFAFVTFQVLIFWIRNWRKGQPKEEDSPKEEDLDLNVMGKDLREYLMLLGVLAASVTYQSGLKPPGGLWQDNNNGHIAGDSILRDIAKGRYRAFFYSNSTSFMASIVVIVLLLPVNKHKFPLWPMHTAILLDMLGLLGAYAAGSTREWEMSRNVIALVVPVLAYIAAYAAVSFFSKKGSVPKEILHEQSQ